MEETIAQFNAREKRKWQIALRRYVLEKQLCSGYAPYFGLDIEMFRQWISLQFTNGVSWENFATAWQFDHIVPVAYFNLKDEEDLKLCWNFINIRVAPTDITRAKEGRIDILGVTNYFEDLYKQTKHLYCTKMLAKLESLVVTNIESNLQLKDFILENQSHFSTISQLTGDEMARLNQGASLTNLMAEREIAKKFG
jgi:hypothetical protein